MGKGASKLKNHNRGVELLVALSQARYHLVTAQHALIQFHLRSGALMLCGVHDSYPVEYFSVSGKEPIMLRQNEKDVLLHTVNKFKLGCLEFQLVFENLKGDDYARFVRGRNSNITVASGLLPPHKRLHAVPQSYRQMVGKAVLHDPMSSGSFGLIYAAVHVRTGELAVKEIVIKDRKAANSRELKAEIDISTSFPVS